MAKELSTGFDYSSLDKDIAAKLQWYASAGRALVRKTQISFIAEFGQMLSDARKLLAHHGDGVFCKWAASEYDLSRQTVYNYLNSWDRCLSNGLTNCQNISPTALYLITRDDTPKAVRDKVLRLCKKQEVVTKADVEQYLPSDHTLDSAPLSGGQTGAGQDSNDRDSRVTGNGGQGNPVAESTFPDTPAGGPGHGAETHRADPSAGASGDPFDEANEEEPWGNEREEEPGAESPPKQREPGIVAKTGREAKVWEAQQVLKQWSDAVGRWMNGNPAGIDAYREEFPGPLGDRVIDAAKELYNSFVAWKKGLK